MKQEFKLANTEFVIEAHDGTDEELETIVDLLSTEIYNLEPEVRTFIAMECFYNEACDGIHYSDQLDKLIDTVLTDNDFYTQDASIKFKKVTIEK